MSYNFTTTCAEADGSPVETATDESFKAVVTLHCAWADRWELAAEISNLLLYPNAPGTLARAKSITIRPFTRVANTTPAQNADYEMAEVTTEYVFDRDTPEEQNQELIAEAIEPTAQNLTLDWQYFRWKTANLKVQPGEAPSLIFRGLDYVLTKYNVVAVPATALTLVGCCNNAQITSPTLGLTFAAQTLLFNPPSIQRRIVLGETPEFKWTLTYRFTFNAGGWNKFWNARLNPPAFDTLQVFRGGAWADYQQYPPASFSGL